MARICFLDIETIPNLVYTWGLWNQNIGLNQIVRPSEMISYAFSFLNGEKAICKSGKEKSLILGLMRVLDDADIVVAHNADRFDIPRIRSVALKMGIKPPSPFKVVDTLKVAKRLFKFESNRLEHLADMLDVKKKGQHGKFPGFELWLQCMKGNKEAWEELEKYNINDVETLEQVYLRMLPWIDNHPNVAVMEEDHDHVCPKCGSKHLQRRGFSYTQVGKYQRYKCGDCGGWSRSRYTEYPKEKRGALLVNAVG